MELQNATSSPYFVEPSTESAADSLRAHDIGHTVRWIVETAVFFISIILNSFLGLVLWRDRKHFSRINLVVFHLMISDLLITFFNIPANVIWIHTKAFLAGNHACKIITFLEQANLFSSSFIVVVISLDRCMAIVHPLSVRQADLRCKVMLTVAWAASFIFSIPQYFVYSVSSPEEDPTFTQCMNINLLSNNRLRWHLDFAFIFIMHYVIPLCILLSCYAAILIKICSRGNGCCFPDKRALYVFRKSSGDTIPRARKKVMRLTVALTLAFLVCWSPFYGMEIWYHLDDEWINNNVSPVVFDSLWSLSYLNVCLDPIMYGFFNIKLCQRCSNNQMSVGPKQNYERIRMLFVIPPWRSKNAASGSAKLP
ncbi:gonadotropin-releasing hormone receptor-like isoform X2 [Apostichopus japonicus]|uniref:gonadotropin-releasing hormone receptor-like isoform X2 n=1 Tax=Stichopus japonicus TaxID=307972 RepID=UPI003AB2230D